MGVLKRRWIYFLGALALLVLGAGFAVQTYWLDHPTGDGPAGPAVPRNLFAKPWTTRPVQILGIGDSVTAGFGASATRFSYFNRLVSNPVDEFPDMKGISLRSVFPQLLADNLAVPGSNSLQHLHDQVLRQEPYSKDVLGIVAMTTGGNDLIHNYGQTDPQECAMYGATMEEAIPWIDNYERRLGAMIRSLSDTFPGGCHIFLANIYDPTDGVGMAWSVGLPPWKDALKVHRAYNAALERCAKQYPFVHLVNIHDPFLGHGIYCRQFWRSSYRRDDPHYWYADNFEDPNDRGYDALRRLFLLEMAHHLSKGL